MPNELPQGQPRKQKADPGSKVATGHVDPCAVYLETTLPGEIPVLITCWAGSSFQVRSTSGKTHLALHDVITHVWHPFKVSGSFLNSPWKWTYNRSRDNERLLLDCSGKFFKVWNRRGTPALHSLLKGNPLTGAIQYLEQDIDASLRLGSGKNTSFHQDQLAAQILDLAPVSWQSIVDIKAGLASQTPARKDRPDIGRPTLVRRLVESILKRKPVAA